jgi:putative hydrolase of the HAD superfamily
VTAGGSEARRELAPRAVSFDAAGTLFHPAEPVGALYAMVAARHGVAIDPGELQRRFRVAFASAPPLAFPTMSTTELRAREKDWWRMVVAHVFDGIPFADFTAYFDDLFAFFASPAAWRLDPDALPLLRMLRARSLTILVVSNFDARVRGIMDALGVSPLVDGVTLSSEAGAAKPDPAIFRTALAAAGLDAGRVVHVGDTVREDLRGARAAGMRVILVGDAELRREASDATVVARLGEVADHLDAAR